MFSKAQTLMDVLNRRKEIEDYLTNLKVERVGSDTVKAQQQQPVTQTQQPVIKTDKPAVVTQAPPPVIHQPAKKDTVQKVQAAPVASAYKFNPQQAQLVMIALDKVDPVYVTETRNAFNRYNRERYNSKTFEINNIPLDENIKLVVLKPFENAEAAIDYITKAKQLATGDIIPWLPATKYSFYLISAENLDILLGTKDLNQYKEAMMQAYPGKF